MFPTHPLPFMDEDAYTALPREEKDRMAAMFEAACAEAGHPIQPGTRRWEDRADDYVSNAPPPPCEVVQRARLLVLEQVEIPYTMEEAPCQICFLNGRNQRKDPDGTEAQGPSECRDDRGGW